MQNRFQSTPVFISRNLLVCILLIMCHSVLKGRKRMSQITRCFPQHKQKHQYLQYGSNTKTAHKCYYYYYVNGVQNNDFIYDISNGISINIQSGEISMATRGIHGWKRVCRSWTLPAGYARVNQRYCKAEYEQTTGVTNWRVCMRDNVLTSEDDYICQGICSSNWREQTVRPLTQALVYHYCVTSSSILQNRTLYCGENQV